MQNKRLRVLLSCCTVFAQDHCSSLVDTGYSICWWPKRSTNDYFLEPMSQAMIVGDDCNVLCLPRCRWRSWKRLKNLVAHATEEAKCSIIKAPLDATNAGSTQRALEGKCGQKTTCPSMSARRHMVAGAAHFTAASGCFARFG